MKLWLFVVDFEETCASHVVTDTAATAIRIAIEHKHANGTSNPGAVRLVQRLQFIHVFDKRLLLPESPYR